MKAEDEGKLEYALRGKAWKVYWLLLKNGRQMSVRESKKPYILAAQAWHNTTWSNSAKWAWFRNRRLAAHFFRLGSGRHRTRA